MKFVQFKVAEKSHVGVILQDENQVISLENVEGYEEITLMVDLIRKMGGEGFSALEKAIEKTESPVTYPLSDVVVSAPIEKPIHDVLCVGVNYKAHLEECKEGLSMTEPPKAVYFSKRSCHILSATSDIPHIQKYDPDFDYEVELAVIIAKEGKDIKASEAEEYIFGYSVFNDLSARTLQKQHVQWSKGKGLDNMSVMGPYIVARDDVAYPPELDISSSVNGEIRQNSNTRMLIHGIGKMIEELSMGCTLEAGDIIITGTPAGVGMGFNPPRYLQVGDLFECTIEGIGSHRNKIV